MVYNKDNYRGVFSKLTDRKDEVETFDNFLRQETSWLISPASSKYHLACKAGLLIHSVNVLNVALKLNEIYRLNKESAIITALYHDVGKVGYPRNANYIPKYNGYIRNRNIVYMDIAHRSLYLIMKYSNIELSSEEAQAILIHDGQYIDANKFYQHNETALATLIHHADWAAAHLVEHMNMELGETDDNSTSG